MKTSIGIEIELNSMEPIRGRINSSMWQSHHEHCGVEIKTRPLAGPIEIRRAIKSIKRLGSTKNSNKCGFDNAGTHIHYDFIPTPDVKNPRKESDLKKIDTSIPERWMCPHCNVQHEEPRENPFGTRYYWTTEKGRRYRSPGEYIREWRPKKPNPRTVYRSSSKKHKKILDSVKRFCIISKRFSNVFFAIQHPDRFLNKYCHTLEFWDEKEIMSARTIEEICINRKLANSHRRHAINVLAFGKYGTIEIRMLQASLDHKDIWSQIFFFGKLVRLAKSDKKIPKSTGNVAADFINLTNAAGIHGRVRRYLTKKIADNKRPGKSRCFTCQSVQLNKEYKDFGLSRPICPSCYKNYAFCAFCGVRRSRKSENIQFLDKKGPGIRHICNQCAKNKKVRLANEKDSGYITVMGSIIPNGFDKDGKIIERL